MAAMIGLFRPNSVASTSKSRSKDKPNRIDSVRLEWSRGHRYTVASTILDDITFTHRSTSISRIGKTSVARAVYIMTLTHRLRALVHALECDLNVSYASFRSLGILYDDEMPKDLLRFFREDEKTRQKDLEPISLFNQEDLWACAESIMGLVSITPN